MISWDIYANFNTQGAKVDGRYKPMYTTWVEPPQEGKVCFEKEGPKVR
jgi:hypothetical protein